MIDYKDAKSVLGLCEKMKPAPWHASHGEFDCFLECGLRNNEPPCSKEIGECEHIKQITPAGVSEIFSIDCGDYTGLTNDEADFIALSREALPYWVVHAKQTEDYNAALLKELEELRKLKEVAVKFYCYNAVSHECCIKEIEDNQRELYQILDELAEMEKE